MIARSISKNLHRAPDLWRWAGILWRENVLKSKSRPPATPQTGDIHTYNEWHLGDNIVHMHFLRKLALQHPDRRFLHAVRPSLIAQLTEIAEDLSNVELIKFADRPGNSINAWHNVGALTPAGGFMDNHPLRIQWAAFHLDWFAHLARQLGLEPPFAKVEDLLFDYPALQKKTPFSRPWSFLLANSTPGSGQFSEYDGPTFFDPVISALTAAGHSVCSTQRSKTGIPCTADAGLTITGVGNVSIDVQYIIMIANGPSWPTFNVWNRDTVKYRIICSDKEVLGLSKNTVQVKSREAIMEQLRARKLI